MLKDVTICRHASLPATNAASAKAYKMLMGTRKIIDHFLIRNNEGEIPLKIDWRNVVGACSWLVLDFN